MGGTDVTFAAWVNAASLAAWTRIWDYGLAAGGASQANWIALAMAGIPAALAIVSDMHSASFQTFTGTSAGTPIFVVGSWVHVAVTIRAAGCAAVIANGAVRQLESPAITALFPSGSVFQSAFLGRSQYADPYFSGRIAVFQQYNAILGPGQLQYLATGQFGPPSPPPLAAVPDGTLACAAGDDPGDCAALVSAFVAWGGRPAAWLQSSGSSLCGWLGVTCSSCSSGRVKFLCARPPETDDNKPPVELFPSALLPQAESAAQPAIQLPRYTMREQHSTSILIVPALPPPPSPLTPPLAGILRLLA